MKVSFWFVVIASVFVTCLITANIIAVKIMLMSGFPVPAGIIIFPLSYLFGDILTEVYGYGAARRVIWLGFACNLLTVIAIYVGGFATSAPFWQNQAAYTGALLLVYDGFTLNELGGTPPTPPALQLTLDTRGACLTSPLRPARR